MSELPKGWTICNLGDVLSVKNGYAFKSDIYSSEGIPLIRISDIQDGKISIENVVFVPQDQANLAFLVEPGDLLIAMSGATTGKTGIYEGKNICLQNQRVGNFKIYSDLLLDKGFRNFYILSLKNKIEIAAYGGAQPNISSSVLESFEFVLPPLNEQRRIVAKLDRLFARSRCAREELGRVSGLVQRYKQAVLAAAFRGDLTADWREQIRESGSVSDFLRFIQQGRAKDYEQGCLIAKKTGKPKPKKPIYLDYDIDECLETSENLPENWIRVPVGILCDCIVPGRDKPKSFTGHIPWITLPDIINDEIDKSSSGLGLTKPEVEEVNARIIPPQSVIMSCIGRFGVSAVATSPLVINQQLHAFVESSLVIPKYLMYHIRVLTNYMNEIATATTISYLNKNNCNSLPINLPPLEEQKQIVQRVEKLFKAIDLMEQEHQKASQLLDRLEQATLSKAFRGELVPQDPNDEPAAVLLERIQAEQQAQPKRKAVRSPQKSGKRSRSSDREVNG